MTDNTNLMSGLTHSNDKNRANEMFKRLHAYGEILIAQEISEWAKMNGWQKKDAEELGTLAQQIDMGKQVKICGGPWWKDNIIDTLRSPHSSN